MIDVLTVNKKEVTLAIVPLSVRKKVKNVPRTILQPIPNRLGLRNSESSKFWVKPLQYRYRYDGMDLFVQMRGSIILCELRCFCSDLLVFIIIFSHAAD
jgi:hypothetical protein